MRPKSDLEETMEQKNDYVSIVTVAAAEGERRLIEKKIKKLEHLEDLEED